MPMTRRTPVMVVPRSHTYSSPRHDYGIEDSINRVDLLSQAVLEDTYDAANRSRGKDKDLLRSVNSAIGTADKTPWYIERAARAKSVALEQALTPRSARGVSMPPGATHHRSKVPPLTLPPEPLLTSGMKASRRQTPAYNAAMLKARARSLDRGGTFGAGSPPALIPSQHLVAHRPALLRKDAALAARARTDPRNPYSAGLRRAASEPRIVERSQSSQHSYYFPALPASQKFYHRVPDASERALSRHLYSHRGRFGPDSKPPRPSLAGFPQVYVPWNGPGPSNRAKESVFARVPSTGSLHASRPPLPKPTERKAIRDVDGFTKPKNLMSWEHRIESRLNPDDIIYEPASLQRMRAQVKGVQEKMDRQRQLLDRYLDKELPSTITSRSEGGPTTSAGGDPDNRPMSDLRRRLRRTLAKSKNNPDYYKE